MDSRKHKKHRLKPLSLYPLTLEEALRLFLQVKPKYSKSAKAAGPDG